MIRWKGTAELTFAKSARLAMIRAVEETHTDVDQVYPDAWMVDDRTVSFHIALESSPAVLESHQRLLAALAQRASSGEAVLFIGPDASRGSTTPMGMERWVRRAHAPMAEELAASHAPGADSKSAAADDDDDDRDTIRTAG